MNDNRSEFSTSSRAGGSKRQGAWVRPKDRRGKSWFGWVFDGFKGKGPCTYVTHYDEQDDGSYRAHRIDWTGWPRNDADAEGFQYAREGHGAAAMKYNKGKTYDYKRQKYFKNAPSDAWTKVRTDGNRQVTHYRDIHGAWHPLGNNGGGGQEVRNPMNNRPPRQHPRPWPIPRAPPNGYAQAPLAPDIGGPSEDGESGTGYDDDDYRGAPDPNVRLPGAQPPGFDHGAAPGFGRGAPHGRGGHPRQRGGWLEDVDDQSADDDSDEGYGSFHDDAARYAPDDDVRAYYGPEGYEEDIPNRPHTLGEYSRSRSGRSRRHSRAKHCRKDDGDGPQDDGTPPYYDVRSGYGPPTAKGYYPGRYYEQSTGLYYHYGKRSGRLSMDWKQPHGFGHSWTSDPRYRDFKSPDPWGIVPG